MTTIRLFGTRLSPFVEKVARGLAYKKIEFELVEPQSLRDFRKWNPQTGKMPVLEIDGERIYDSTFILRQLDQRFPEPSLLSDDARVAAAQRQLEDWSDESLYWYIMAVRWSAENAPASAQQITAAMPRWIRPLVRRAVPRQICRMTRAQGMGRLPRETLLNEFGRLLDDAVWMIGSKPFFYAERLSVADLAIHGQLHMARSGPTPEVAALISHRPVLTAFAKRVEDLTGR